MRCDAYDKKYLTSQDKLVPCFIWPALTTQISDKMFNSPKGGGRLEPELSTYTVVVQ